MNENKREFTFNYGGKDVIIETGRLAKQTDGAVLVTSGNSQVLVTVCSATKQKPGQDFFPLLVDFTEKFYAAGRFLGGFMKREARPGMDSILVCRMIDRPLRPLFPAGYMFETIVQITTLSWDQNDDIEVLGGLGASAALAISDIPFAGPIANCKVGRIDGKLVLNPALNDYEKSDMEVVVAASKDALLMVEGEANELAEEDMLAALEFAHENIKGFCGFIDSIVKEVGVKKREFKSVAPNIKLVDTVTKNFSKDGRDCLKIIPKIERGKAISALTSKVSEAVEKDFSKYGLEENAEFGKEAYGAVDELMYNMMRKDILEKELRIGGRPLDVVRPIETEVDILKIPHGSSLFTRGETQVMATVTLGSKDGEMMIDDIKGIRFKRFYLHYSFPPFSVGEARGYRGAGRREIGHGFLAERSIRKVLPSFDDFPYTIRVACEVLESNGSSSMGSICSGALALMDAGVPIKKPVAGVAMGLIKEGDNYKILTDILGDEDHLGDMDFKVAGTKDGITGIQMDIKISGITFEILKKAMTQAKTGRLHILEEMGKTMDTTRSTMKPGTPRVDSIQIPKDKIGALIGPGGKNIKYLQSTYEVDIETDEAGKVQIFGSDPEKISECKTVVNLQINGPEVGSEYEADVITIKDYGAFVDIIPGVSGLVHISEFSKERVQDANDYVKEGMKIMVKVIDIDNFGRVKLSAKAVKPLSKLEK